MPADEYALLLQTDRREVHQGRQVVSYQTKRPDLAGKKSRDQFIEKSLLTDSISRLRLLIDHFIIYDFLCAVADIVHLPHPLHLILCFELLGHPLTLCYLFY